MFRVSSERVKLMSTMASSFGSKVSNIHSMTIHFGSVTPEHSWKQARVNVMFWSVNIMSCGVNVVF
jgi:predicted secreted hydrolase